MKTTWHIKKKSTNILVGKLADFINDKLANNKRVACCCDDLLKASVNLNDLISDLEEAGCIGPFLKSN